MPADVRTRAGSLAAAARSSPRRAGGTNLRGSIGNRSWARLAGAARVQRKFVALGGERIQELVAAAKQDRGEDLDADYLEGLFERQGDTGKRNPELFFQVTKLAKQLLTGNPLDLNQVRVFAAASTVEAAEAKLAQLDQDKNLLQIVAEDTRLYGLNEDGPYTFATIRSNATKLMGGQMGELAVQEYLGKVLIGGDYEGEAGAYGNIEFRFKASKGRLVVASEAENNPGIAQILLRNPQVQKDVQDAHVLAKWKKVYTLAKLPHPEERMGSTFLFVADTDKDRFGQALSTQMRHELMSGPPLAGAESGLETAANVPRPLVAPPLYNATTKEREKEYTTRAPRGSRMQGQKAAMANWSAAQYASYFNPQAQQGRSWEWLHLQGSRLGGPNLDTNLVAGTTEANSAMIPYERAIYRLSRTATADKPVKVTWKATLKKGPDGRSTSIGDKISITVAFPQGAPPERDGIDPARTASPFPVTFNALEAAPVTKFDRDITEVRSGRDLT